MYSIVFAGPINSRSGYGARSLDIARTLVDGGYNVGFILTSWGNCPNNVLDKNNPQDNEILSRIITTGLNYKPSVFLQCTIPNEFQPIGIYNIGITAGIETDTCRLEWIEGCNKMDLVLVSSNHARNVFKNIKFDKVDKQTQQSIEQIGLTTKCEVLIEGCDVGVYTPKNITSIPSLDNLPKFNFLCVGHWLQGDLGADRKDIGMLIHTFLNTFIQIHPKNQPGLVLKVSGAGFSITEKEAIITKIEAIKKMVKNATTSKNPLPPIYLLYGDLTDLEMNSVYNHPAIKAMVSFTHGEGFGRPLLEFKTTNKPIVASGWSGHVDFLDKETSVLLPGQLAQVPHSAVNDWIIAESRWFNVDYNVAAQFLFDMFKNYDKYLDKSRKNNTFVKNNFSTANMTEQLNSFIQDKIINVPILTQLQLPIINN